MAEVFDLRDNIDVSKVQADSIGLGTDMQDCALIARTYERAAHATPTEAAVFATINRQLENNRSFSKAAQTSLSGYLRTPQDSAEQTVGQASTLAASAGVSVSTGTAGTSTQLDSFFQGLNIGQTGTSTLGSTFGNTMLDWAKDCIPCGLRLEAFLELNPSVDLLDALEADLKNKLDGLMSIIDMLKDITSYQNICDLIDMLSFMCIPDLQRLIATLMALLLLDVPELDGLIGLLVQLVAPIFAPIFIAITALLDQFVALVTNPLECVIDAFEEQISKLNLDVNVGRSRVSISTKPATDAIEETREELAKIRKEMNQFSEGIRNSIQELTNLIQEGIAALKDKLDFYISEIKAMMAELGLGDGTYLRLSLRKLSIIRFISFIIAVITALASGEAVCQQNKTPTTSEIDSFFNNYLNPNSAFDMWVGEDGNIHIAEPGLPNDGNVFIFKGDDLLSPSILEKSQNIEKALATPIQVATPCRFKTTESDADKVNTWIAELSS